MSAKPVSDVKTSPVRPRVVQIDMIRSAGQPVQADLSICATGESLFKAFRFVRLPSTSEQGWLVECPDSAIG